MGQWNADVVTEPAQDHALCVDLFEGHLHRGCLQANERGELVLISHGDAFEVPALWLANTIQRFAAEAPVRGA